MILIGADRESSDDLANGGFRFRRDLLRRLVLNRMLDVDRVEIGSSQRAGLRAGRGEIGVVAHELERILARVHRRLEGAEREVRARRAMQRARRQS